MKFYTSTQKQVPPSLMGLVSRLNGHRTATLRNLKELNRPGKGGVVLKKLEYFSRSLNTFWTGLNISRRPGIVAVSKVNQTPSTMITAILYTALIYRTFLLVALQLINLIPQKFSNLALTWQLSESTKTFFKIWIELWE